MDGSHIIDDVCGYDYDLVTYDLTTIKIAKRIQSEETLIFDNLFIFFGSFHTEMSLFLSLRKMIEGSGGPYALHYCRSGFHEQLSMRKYV